MPHIKLVFYAGVCLMNFNLLSAQKTPDIHYLQKAVGRQVYEQKQWNIKQLPPNSSFYKLNVAYNQNSRMDFSSDKIRVYAFSNPAFFNSSFPSHSYNYTVSRAPDLQSFLKYRKQQDNNWQKQNWWKDPSKSKGAYLLRDHHLNDKNPILY